VNYRRTTYTKDYYGNDEYDKVFIEASSSGPLDSCYQAYPDPPVVRFTKVYKPPSTPEPTTTTPAPDTGLNCDNPTSQAEYEQCHPPQEAPPTTTETTPPDETSPGKTPGYDCPDLPPAHPGPDYLENCG
jgi:hypothetical protein